MSPVSENQPVKPVLCSSPKWSFRLHRVFSAAAVASRAGRVVAGFGRFREDDRFVIHSVGVIDDLLTPAIWMGPALTNPWNR